MEPLIKFKNDLKQLNIELTDQQIDQFISFYELLVEKNKVMNLTAITEFEDVLCKHFIDSLSLVNVVDLRQPAAIIDVGTGAGFPGIPLKIAFPHLEIVLMDSLNKRIKFLQETASELGLKNLTAIHSRAEELGQNKDYREKFDYCVSRAVSNLAVLSEYCLPFVKTGGQFISYKSGNISEELNESERAIELLGGCVSEVKSYRLPSSDIDRTLVCISKDKMTPKRYPRKPGTPAKERIK